jgi:hypothetical protein
VPASATDTNADPRLPLGFIVATFAVAAAVGALILYLGIQGQLGAAIP